MEQGPEDKLVQERCENVAPVGVFHLFPPDI